MQQNTDPRRIIVEITNHCNLNCSMCLSQSWSESPGSMSDKVFSKLVSGLREFAFPPDVMFGGYGEPLSHPDILDMIEEVAVIGSQTALITNGSLLSPYLVDSLVQAGLNKLWISVDSSHRDALLQTQKGKPPAWIMDQLSAIMNSRNGNLKKLEPGLAFVMTRNNKSEIIDCLDQGQKFGCKSFFITNLEAFSESLAEETPYTLKDLRLPGSWRSTYSDLIEISKLLSTEIPGITLEGTLTEERSKCPFAEKRDLVLRWDGEISPCLPLLYDSTTHIGSWEHKQYAYSFGNILERSVSEIWSDNANYQLRERLLDNEFSPCLGCRDCWFSDDNRQDCMGFEHPTCGGCLWAAGLISCP